MTAYRPQPYPWVTGLQPNNPGISGGPRVSAIGEHEANTPRVWPTQYGWRLMGLGAMPLFQLGYTAPVFNNQFAPMSVGRNIMIPRLSRLPFGG